MCSSDLSGDALPLMLAGDLGIEKESVIAAVPCNVDEADQAVIRLQARGHPAKAVRTHLIPPPGRNLPTVC